MHLPNDMLRPRGGHHDTGDLSTEELETGNYFFINAIIVFFFALCGISLAVRLAKMASHHVRQIVASGSGREHQQYFMGNKTAVWPWIKKHVLYAPTWKHRHNKVMQISSAVSIGTLPSRFHTVLLVVYVLTNFAYCAALDYKNEPAVVLIAELRGRSGALAAINVIPTILFALRNNPFISMLRVSYDTFNLLHRWVARIVIIESIVHVVAWAVNDVNEYGTTAAIGKALGESSFLQYGTISWAAFVLLAIQAWSPIRHAFYEVFLNVHRLVALVASVGLWLHLAAAELPQMPYVELAFVLWGLELLMRVARLAYYNLTRQQRTQCTVEALQGEACRVTFDLARPWAFRPGCHVHAYFPALGGWASHPFSVAWSADQLRSTTASGDDKLELPTTEKPGLTDLDHSPRIRTSISLVVRARTGLTRKLFDRASAAPGGKFTTAGAVEGPYGGHEALESYGTLLLFAGGVGITHQIGHIRSLLQGVEAGTVATRRILLVWSVPNTRSLEWVRPWMDEILRMKARRDTLRIMVFITKPESQSEFVSSTGTVQMIPGRCNPQSVLDKEFIERVGAMCVTVCGPGAFADGVRAAARRRVQLGSLDFIEEAFTY